MNRFKKNQYNRKSLVCCLIISITLITTGLTGEILSNEANAEIGASLGRVHLDEMSTPLKSLGMIVGATYDKKNGRLNLIGDGKHQEASPSLQQIAVAFQWAFSDSLESNYVSIDPWPDDPLGPWMQVRINEDAYDTEFGWIMFEADRMMKAYSLGVDNVTGVPIHSSISGYQNINQIALTMVSNSTRQGEWSRFWLCPLENSVEATDTTMRIGKARIGIRTEPMRMEGGTLVSSTNDPTYKRCKVDKRKPKDVRDKTSEQFAEFFTEHYEEFSNEEPVFRKLEQLMRLLLVSEWIRKEKIPINLDWIDRFRKENFRLPRVTPSLNVRQERSYQSGNVITREMVQIFGGTDLNVTPNYVMPLSQSFSAWENAVRAAATTQTGIFGFKISGNPYAGITLPAGTNASIFSAPQPLLELNLGNGKTVSALQRRTTQHHDDSMEWSELALPRLYMFNPTGQPREGQPGMTQSFGIQGHSDSTVEVKTYQLYDVDGSFLGRFERHDIDQVDGNVFVQPTNTHSPWKLYPKGNGVVLARGPHDRRLAFDGESGLLLGEQIGDDLIKYKYSQQGLLSLISVENQSDNITLMHGRNGYTYLSAKSSDGKQVNLTDPMLDFGKQTIEVSNEVGEKDTFTIDSQTENFTRTTQAGGFDFIDRKAGEISRALARSTDKIFFVSLLPDGGLTHIVTKVTVDPVQLKDLARLSHDLDKDSRPWKILETISISPKPEQSVVVFSDDLHSGQGTANLLGRQRDSSVYFTDNSERAKVNISKIESSKTVGPIQVDIQTESLKDKPEIEKLMKKYQNDSQGSNILVVVAHTTDQLGDYLLEKIAPKASGKFVILFNCGGPTVENNDLTKINQKMLNKYGAISVTSYDRLLNAESVDEVIQTMQMLGKDKEKVRNPKQFFKEALEETIIRLRKSDGDENEILKDIEGIMKNPSHYVIKFSPGGLRHVASSF